MHSRIIILFIFCFCSWTGEAQSSVKKLKVDAEQYYTNHKYPEALNLFLKYQRVKSIDSDTRYKIAYCYLETNQPQDARQYFEALVAEKKKAPFETYFYIARSYHIEHEFNKAVEWYKKFLNVTSKKGHLFRDATKDAIRRCVNGFSQTNTNVQQVIVENLGELINSTGDDIAPILSPNHDGRIYFSSSREGNVGGMRLANGIKDETFGDYKTDIFTASIINGQWGGATALDPLLNSSKNDVVLGFNSSGTVLYYFKGLNLYSGETFVDTFGMEKTAEPPYFYSPAIAENGDVDLLFFNDTTLLFSSDREGGYGGKDLYIAIFTNGQWMKPYNLGPTINSPYDEVTPFLAADGRTLYFSSNNLNSMGDLDIFKSRFNDPTSTWSTPENLGVPFNSAREDVYFKLSRDGMKAFFSSSRKESLGKKDIYVAYFNSSKGEQRQSKPAIFTEILYAKKQQGSFVSTNPAIDNWTSTGGASHEAELYELSNLFFDANGAILNKDNKLTLENVAILLKKFPSIKLELISHTDPSGQDKFDLYFSAKRAEEVMGYLIGKGVAPSSIFLRGCGSSYPIAKNETESGSSEIGRKLNRRIELAFHRTNGQPVKIKLEKANIPGFLQTDTWQEYNKSVKGISYKIQIADIKQMYNGDLLTKLPNATIESNGAKDSYQYTIGLFQNYSSAHLLQQELVRQGVPDAFVVPYIDGLRASIGDAKIFATAYPDLYNYLRSVEE